MHLLRTTLLSLLALSACAHRSLLPASEGEWIECTARPDAEPLEGTMRIDLLDVGQGLAVLVTSPTGFRMLVDGGRHPERLAAELEALGIDRLDLVVATHAHGDHVGGLPGAAALLREARVVGSPHLADRSKDWQALESLLGRPIEPLRRGDGPIDLGGGVFAEVLSPPLPPLDYRGSDRNHNSVVLALRAGACGALLTADIEKQTEAWLLRRDRAALRADVLQVAHHGADTSSGGAFLRAVDPSVALLSVGRENPFGDPDRPVLSRLEDQEVEIWRTDLHGPIEVHLDGARLMARRRPAPFSPAR